MIQFQLRHRPFYVFLANDARHMQNLLRPGPGRKETMTPLWHSLAGNGPMDTIDVRIEYPYIDSSLFYHDFVWMNPGNRGASLYLSLGLALFAGFFLVPEDALCRCDLLSRGNAI